MQPYPRPWAILTASQNSSESRQAIMNAEQQDSHEFFVMLTEAIGDELEKLERGTREASEAVSFGLQSISRSVRRLFAFAACLTQTT
jgi:hypothetical protein